ncbi:G patch domain-containing protein 1 [Neocloeon triangulifer]|uniref:G patch domain-containing protein 1 n=1 Tax=Neocloeon triangulifer TaxID=2078957 RepID=UPI00286EDAF5|nr:G patch domain-containing protein 1 [Neocloeon triangulifer]
MGSEQEANYTVYGTQLEELTEDDLWAKKPIPIEEQIATDKQGRRRFHGAFTGGFSAGYFNTVGSEEGWTPTTFKSSRAEKAAAKFAQQRPEDFMDDEDQEVFGIAPKVLRARQEYKKASTTRSATTTGLLDSLLKPVRDTVGVVLLKRMGWKPGQGVGPRQTAQEKKQRRKLVKKSQKVYGCAMGPQREESEEESEEGSDLEEVTFAPDDLPSFPVAPKTNTFGMGYVGLDKNSQLFSSSGHFSLFEPPEAVMNAKKTGIGIKGQAFGVGAFEKEDDDIYGGDDMTRYDFYLESTAESKKRRLKEKKEAFEKKKRHGESRCLENFALASQKISTVKFYPPPSIPKHFVPKHGVKQSRFSELKPEVAERLSQPKGRHDLTAKERGILVGEMEKRVETLAAPKPMPVLDFEVVPTELKPGQFNPFSHNPEKLVRYQQFLTLRKMKQTDKFVCLQPQVMTEWEKTREQDEFEQAAVLYQPLSGQISDRFVSSATLIGSEETPRMDVQKPVEESVQAAKQKMFGKMTRTTEPWHPHALLCKRFNVPDPHSGLAPTNNRKRPNFSVFDFLAAQPVPVEEVQKPPEDSKRPVEVPKAASSAEPPATSKELPAQKPPEVFTTEKMSVEDKMDLFKSVFLDSSDDEQEAPHQKEPTPPPAPKRPRSPPKGVFKTLDLIAPREKPPPAQVEKQPEKLPEPSSNLYGPALPPSLPSATTFIAPIVDSASASKTDFGGEWVEKASDKQHKKHKRKKSRSQSRDRKRRKGSEGDDQRHKKKKKKKHKH